MKYNLSEINGVIRERRSIKPENFSTRTVHREIIENMLENARWAPTHGMTQPWHFVVFTEEGRRKFADYQQQTYKKTTSPDSFVEAKFNQLGERPLCASAVIAITMKRQDIEKIPEVEEVEAVACAVQNMMLTATAYGIGAYWSSGGFTYTDGMKAFLGLSDKDKCLGFLYIGYPEGEWPKSQRRPIDTFTRWEEK
ncbi:MAG: nitroreductase [Flavobacteriales bacterium]|nr:nitroreductase [Flavobacteriales bacterium]